ncbi:PaaX family transcriptional regulator C-terminal domain-containing protein [Pelagicoccus sp. SDUM812002]|nr:PaaX family transcriptional regulator C-terminal domain-containing protein [Pelagicoccus sp. SDUM812002]
MELITILADLSAYGVTLASGQLAKICLEAYGGSNRAYLNLLRRLEKSGHISVESRSNAGDSAWVPNLTAAGESATRSPSPFAAWESAWDGKWRLLTFDLPSHASNARFELRDWLKTLRFGKLQGSVWISHRALPEVESSFAALRVSADSVVCMEGIFWSCGDDASYVVKAWPLYKIQAAYSDYLSFLDTKIELSRTLTAYQAWRARERSLWDAALKNDPLLPKELWPTKRLGANLALEAEARREDAVRNWLEAAQNW